MSRAKSLTAQNFPRWPRVQGGGLRRLRRKEIGWGWGAGTKGWWGLGPYPGAGATASWLWGSFPLGAGGSSVVGEACARKPAGSTPSTSLSFKGTTFRKTL